jgi:hypothetical protein
MPAMRWVLAARLVGAIGVFVLATYCLVTLRDPIPSLSRALDDRHAYFATTLLVLAPILLVWHVALVIAAIKRAHAAIPYAAIRRSR